jgi:hypothetical protein
MSYRPKICYKVEGIANMAAYFASDHSPFANGRYLLLSGGATLPSYTLTVYPNDIWKFSSNSK